MVEPAAAGPAPATPRLDREKRAAIERAVAADKVARIRRRRRWVPVSVKAGRSRKFVGIAEVTGGTGELAGYSGTVVGMGAPRGLLTTGTICKLKE